MYPHAQVSRSLAIESLTCDVPYNTIVDLLIPVWEGTQTGRALFLPLAEVSELLEDVNRVRRIEI